MMDNSSMNECQQVKLYTAKRMLSVLLLWGSKAEGREVRGVRVRVVMSPSNMHLP